MHRLEKLNGAAEKVEIDIDGLMLKLGEKKDEKKAQRLEKDIDDLEEEKKGILAERRIVAEKLHAGGMQVSCSSLPSLKIAGLVWGSCLTGPMCT